MINKKLMNGNLTYALALLVLYGTGCVETRAPVTVTCTLPNGVQVLAECQDIRAAQMKLRELKKQGKFTGPIEVVLRKGVYSITEPLRFTSEDSGTEQASITYRAEKPGTVTVSGGRQITGWCPESNGVWRADVPEVREGKLYFRQMFIDGRRAVRARSPNTGFYHTTGLIREPGSKPRKADGIYYAGNDMTESIASSPDTMLTVYQSWMSHQYRVKVFKPETKAVFLDPEMDVTRTRSRYVVENAPACLDTPGEWFLDRQTGIVRYIPLPGEDMQKIMVIVPVTPSLLQFKGDPEHGACVEYLHFKGITFAEADWSPQGRSIGGSQAWCPTGFDTPDIALESGAISAIGLKHTSIEECEITRVGEHAVVLMQGCANNLVRKCHMHDLGGGGVYLFWAVPNKEKRAGWSPRNAYDTIVSNVIDNCYIHDMTYVFNGAVGVLTGPCAAYNRITHNEVSHGDYTGISIGWGWSANKNAGFFQYGNVVENNNVHHVMNYLLDDGGGIYLLGWQKGTRICRNWIHDVRHDTLGHGAKGIYPDEGTSGVLFEGNVVHDVVQAFGGNGGHECVVRNNIFAFFQKSGVIGGGRLFEPGLKYNPNPLVFEHNIIYEEGGNAMLMRTNYRPDVQVSSNNVYWAGAANASAPLFSGAGQQFVTFADWQTNGHDVGSVMADPLFVNATGRDLRLHPDSPALKMGFKQTDLSSIGLYGDREWTSLPGKTRHAPIVPLPGPGGFEWTYEDEMAGVVPVHSGQLAQGYSNQQQRIVVTDTDAISGKHSLMFVEGKKTDRHPHLYYPIGVDNGSIRASIHIKIPSTTPSAMYLEFRDSNNAGSKHFQTGPRIQIDVQGVLTTTTNASVNLKLPRDVWILLDMAFDLGNGMAKTFDLTVTVPGQSPQIFRQVPYMDPGFMQVGDIYIVSSGPPGGVFLIDDVRVSTSRKDK
ncbi:MAG: right-handed parallel beta-helix repeat-containing protein [Kiritimatiellae bacterium]|nr:right-handed parallel beta-helix repeat-containing protein [Kiritimatiellia bacterium]MDD5519396.1 right-handed parallel beta-helix repeat-containing protein [Kiritimatiellia bacterium]